MEIPELEPRTFDEIINAIRENNETNDASWDVWNDVAHCEGVYGSIIDDFERQLFEICLLTIQRCGNEAIINHCRAVLKAVNYSVV